MQPVQMSSSEDGTGRHGRHKITVSFANVRMIKSFQQQAVSYSKIAQPIPHEG